MNETMQTISRLATTHGDFTDKPVSTEDLQAVATASLRAANASARQSYSLITLDDSELIYQLCGYRVPAAILYCVDYNRLMDTAAHLGHGYHPDGLLAFITGSTDTILAAQTGVITATSLGLDSLLTNGVHRGDIHRVYQLLNLPKKYCFPSILLLLGYAEHATEPRGRWSGAGLMHHGSYRPMAPEEIDEMCRQFDKPANRMGLEFYPNSPSVKGRRYYDWFFNAWTKDSSHQAQHVVELLKETGFIE